MDLPLDELSSAAWQDLEDTSTMFMQPYELRRDCDELAGGGDAIQDTLYKMKS